MNEMNNMHPSNNLPSSNDDSSISLQQVIHQAALDRADLEELRRMLQEQEQNQEKQHWIEAEQWLAHHYPEHRWKVWNSGTNGHIISIHQHNGITDERRTIHIYRNMFRMLTSQTDFHTAMNHILIVNNLMHIRDIYNKPE